MERAECLTAGKLEWQIDSTAVTDKLLLRVTDFLFELTFEGPFCT